MLMSWRLCGRGGRRVSCGFMIEDILHALPVRLLVHERA